MTLFDSSDKAETSDSADLGANASSLPGRGPNDEKALGAFRKVPRTGVIYVMGEAAKHGYRSGTEPGPDAWANLGQGRPEVGA